MCETTLCDNLCRICLRFVAICLSSALTSCMVLVTFCLVILPLLYDVGLGTLLFDDQRVREHLFAKTCFELVLYQLASNMSCSNYLYFFQLFSGRWEFFAVAVLRASFRGRRVSCFHCGWV